MEHCLALKVSDSLWDVLNKIPYNLSCGDMVLVSSQILRNKYGYDYKTGRFSIGLLLSDAIKVENFNDDYFLNPKIYHKNVYRILFQSKILSIDRSDIHGRVSDEYR